MEALGFFLGKQLLLRPRALLLLQGPLGAGKTLLVQGIAKALGIKEPITSPTFVTLHSYLDQKPFLHHFDLYRLEKESDFWDQGFGEVLEDEGIVAVEWPSRLSFLTGKGLLLEIRQGAKEEEREVLFSSSTEEKLVHSLLSYAPFA